MRNPKVEKLVKMALLCAMSLALLHRGISLTIFAQCTHVERSRRMRAA